MGLRSFPLLTGCGGAVSTSAVAVRRRMLLMVNESSVNGSAAAGVRKVPVNRASAVSRAELLGLRRKFEHYLLRWRRDPVAYAWEACHCELTDRQAAALHDLARHHFVAIRSGHGVGKTRLLALAVNWFGDTQWSPGTAVKIPCTGPSGANLQDVLWSEIATVNKGKLPWLRDRWVHNSDRFYCEDMRDECFAVIRTARPENPDALQGFHGKVLYIIDEPTGVPEAIFEVARGALTEESAYAIMTGNPTRDIGYFHRAFNSRTMWKPIHVDCRDTLTTQVYEYEMADPKGDVVVRKVRGRVSPRYIEEMKADYGEDSNTFRIRVLGEFGTGTGDQVIVGKTVLAAFSRAATDQGKRKRVMGVDVARYGDDTTALVIRHGRVVEHCEQWQGHDTYVSRHRIESTLAGWSKAGKPIDEVVIDTIGYGAGIYDDLNHRGFPVVSCDVIEKAPEDREANCHRLRDWLWWRGRLFFMQTDVAVLPDAGDPEVVTALRDELTKPTYTIPLDKVKVESKDELRSRGFRSPNLADAFLLTLRLDWDEQARPKRDTSKKARRAAAVRRSWRVI